MEHVYIIKAGFLEIGDIILTNGDNEFKGNEKKELFPKVIRTGIGSCFSHAMIYVGDSCAHAVMNGVHFFNISKYYIYSTQEIKVLRYKEPLSKSEKEIIRTFIIERQGNPYDKSGAIRSGVKKNKSNNINKQFCSKLIANSYDKIGKKIDLNIESQNITPKELEISKNLIEINVEFDKISKEEASKKVNPKSLMEQDKAVNSLTKKLKEISEKYCIDLGSLNETLYKKSSLIKNHKKCEQINRDIIEAIKLSKYDNFWIYDYKDNPEFYFLNSKMKFLENCGEEKEKSHYLTLAKVSYTSLTNEKERLKYLFQNIDLDLNLHLISLFTKIIEKQYKITYLNYEMFGTKLKSKNLKEYNLKLSLEERIELFNYNMKEINEMIKDAYGFIKILINKYDI